MTTHEDDRLLVTEIFSAIQGEGALVGERQVFLRLTGCNIRCDYCDQPESLDRRGGPCRIERLAGRRIWDAATSPLPLSEVADAVDRLWKALPHHSVSVTGGEPLVQSRRLAQLFPLLIARRHRIFLETNAMLIAGFRRVLPWTDLVSADIKLHSVDGQDVDRGRQRDFLELAASRDCYAKIVLGPATDPGELDAAVRMVHDVSPDMEIFLQPVTPFATVTSSPTPEQVLALQERALHLHPRVRVVPQSHKLIGQL